ncbi:MAG: class I SAM-dependent methyltransferase [Oscillospiraceae bacterium]|nr:class I SAM-dependent methyltransferase [Oscillospiraceae bacterium]
MISKSGIDGGKGFDWGKASEDYAKYRDIYPGAFYRKIIDLNLCVKGQTVLDLGTGTGVLPRNLYKYGAKFIGADISENQIGQARRLSADAGMDIEYVIVSAENFDFPDNSFDVVTACQCFQYFDRAAALPRIHRALKDGGHFCILFMVWITGESEIARRGEELVLKYNPAWTGGGDNARYIPAAETPGWAAEWYETANAEGFDVHLTFTRESWHGRMKACRGIGASSLTAEEIAQWEKEHTEYLRSMPEPFDIPHFVTILNLRKKSL